MNDGIMKSDRRGRLRYSPEQKTALVEAYESSGLSGPRFAELHGVNYQTLANWIQKRKRAATPGHCGLPHPALISLVAAEIEGARPAGESRALEITLPGGARLALAAPGQVQLAAALIRELERPLPC